MKLKNTLKIIAALVIVLLFTCLAFFVGIAATDYYTHTEQFYEALNPDVLMAMHGYLPVCTNETVVTISDCDFTDCFDIIRSDENGIVYCGSEQVQACTYIDETRHLCGWQKWTVDD